jgi:glycosyltransferase involved in cell wall biosynthesis
MQNKFTDPIKKSILRKVWRALLYLHGWLTPLWGVKKRHPRVFYGGARPGNIGGPLVKVNRLQKNLPEYLFSYNAVYLLSNTPYLTKSALERLKNKKIPILLNQNGVFYPGWYSGDWEKQNNLMSKAYHSADHVFWQSKFCQRAADKFLGERTGEGTILYNAVDTSLFSPRYAERSIKPFTFLVTGKINKHLTYRLETTLQGLSLARAAGLECVLRIDGWVEDIKPILQLAKKLGVSNYLSIGAAYTQEQAPSIYQNADAYVMTKYLDPCPNTVIEAMACGLPILYSYSGGVPELVGLDAGVGLALPEDWKNIHIPDSHAIAQGMMEIAENQQTMRLAARERAVNFFDLKNWIDQHRLVLQDLLRR